MKTIIIQEPKIIRIGYSSIFQEDVDLELIEGIIYKELLKRNILARLKIQEQKRIITLQDIIDENKSAQDWLNENI